MNLHFFPFSDLSGGGAALDLLLVDRVVRIVSPFFPFETVPGPYLGSCRAFQPKMVSPASAVLLTRAYGSKEQFGTASKI